MTAQESRRWVNETINGYWACIWSDGSRVQGAALVYVLGPSSPHLGFLWRYKVVSQGLHGKLHSVPQFVAEVAVTQDAVDIQVDVSTWETDAGMQGRRQWRIKWIESVTTYRIPTDWNNVFQCFDLFDVVGPLANGGAQRESEKESHLD